MEEKNSNGSRVLIAVGALAILCGGGISLLVIGIVAVTMVGNNLLQ